MIGTLTVSMAKDKCKTSYAIRKHSVLTRLLDIGVAPSTCLRSEKSTSMAVLSSMLTLHVFCHRPSLFYLYRNPHQDWYLDTETKTNFTGIITNPNRTSGPVGYYRMTTLDLGLFSVSAAYTTVDCTRPVIDIVDAIDMEHHTFSKPIYPQSGSSLTDRHLSPRFADIVLLWWAIQQLYKYHGKLCISII